MKNRIFTFIFITILSFTLNSCNNDDDNIIIENFNGNYTGTFTVIYTNGDTFSNPVTLSFNEDNGYLSSSNNDYFPAGGSGTYENDNSIIEFYDINLWTANFDGNLILNGEYNYLISGSELLISANKNGVGFYKYQLTKE